MSAIASQITGVTIKQFIQPFLRRRSKKASKLRVTSLCDGNSPVTGEFPALMASNAEYVSIWWRHHDLKLKIPFLRNIYFHGQIFFFIWHS